MKCNDNCCGGCGYAHCGHGICCRGCEDAQDLRAEVERLREEYNAYVMRVVAGESEHIEAMQRGIARLAIDGVITASLAAEIMGVRTEDFRRIANEVAADAAGGE